MREAWCPHEDSVRRAARSGQWSENLRTHLAGCRTCSEVEQVVRWMGGLAERVADESALPNPAVIWLKSRLVEQKLREERALSRVVLARAMAKSGLLAALSLSFYWIWPAIDTGIATMEAWVSWALTATSGEPLLDPVTPAVVILLALSLRYILRYSGRTTIVRN